MVHLDVELDVVRHSVAFASNDAGPRPVERRAVIHWEAASGGFAVGCLFVPSEVGEGRLVAATPGGRLRAGGRRERGHRAGGPRHASQLDCPVVMGIARYLAVSVWRT